MCRPRPSACEPSRRGGKQSMSPQLLTPDPKTANCPSAVRLSSDGASDECEHLTIDTADHQHVVTHSATRWSPPNQRSLQSRACRTLQRRNRRRPARTPPALHRDVLRHRQAPQRRPVDTGVPSRAKSCQHQVRRGCLSALCWPYFARFEPFRAPENRGVGGSTPPLTTSLGFVLVDTSWGMQNLQPTQDLQPARGRGLAELGLG